jgi:hypothetical protein
MTDKRYDGVMPKGFNPQCVRCNEYGAACGNHGDKVFPPTPNWTDKSESNHWA